MQICIEILPNLLEPSTSIDSENLKIFMSYKRKIKLFPIHLIFIPPITPRLGTLHTISSEKYPSLLLDYKMGSSTHLIEYLGASIVLTTAQWTPMLILKS